MGWLNDRPVLWTVAITIVIVGGMYFAAVRRLKPSQLQAPEGESSSPESELPSPAAGT